MFVYMSTRANKQPRQMQIATRVEPELFAAIERAAEQERRTVSNLVRNVISDWAAARAAGDQSRQAA
jgi:uncharacterized protein (DUF1778 family)